MCVDDTDNRGIRVVLSSRFQDMKAERNYLVEKILLGGIKLDLC
mgnify:CR=1 FL=1